MALHNYKYPCGIVVVHGIGDSEKPPETIRTRDGIVLVKCKDGEKKRKIGERNVKWIVKRRD